MNSSNALEHTAPLFHRINPTVKRLGVSRATLYRLVGAGELELVKVGPKASGITHQSLVKFCAARGIAL
ncbi:transcriptional regulator, AlpA family [Pseudogulbenkiania subflava DSM 22618]|uniref:Transcriptional regulator, AlpA family n=1 Tax=Pseudogulbenkiania subflava DSM 22618 TaxID=1123014 RepID=A0A1Y6C7C6_9NEIS|nr:transcriptional regulator, AlpA family [Pseudogulbenkiania subflava DSM 22618]